MPYITEQLKFNLAKDEGRVNNKAITRQPSPMLLTGIENTLGYNMTTMATATTLARRDIRLGNYNFKDDDLDLIPVKEEKRFVTTRKAAAPKPSLPIGVSPKPTSPMLHGSFSPGRCLVKRSPVWRAAERGCFTKHRTPEQFVVSKQRAPEQFVVSIPTAGTECDTTSRSRQSVTTMIETLLHAYRSLGKTSSKKGYPDAIEEERLQRRVEEQRRHLYRMLYNTKRHICQLAALLERTPFKYRGTMLTQSSTLCHMTTAYRSLMSGLSSFIRVSHALHSSYMTDLKKKVRSEIKVLLEELERVDNMLDIQITSLEPSSPSNIPVLPSNTPVLPSKTPVLPSNTPVLPSNTPVLPRNPISSITKLNLSDLKSSSNKAPLSPERNESLRAAVRSLLKSALYDSAPRNKSAQPQQRSFAMNKAMPNRKSGNKKVIKPKSKSAKSTKPAIPGNRTGSATNLKKEKRPLGRVARPERPYSAPSSSLEVHGGLLTPYITERELARQAWIDELGKGQRSLGGCIVPAPSVETTPRPTRPYDNTTPHHDNTARHHDNAEQEPVFKSREMSTTMVELLDELEEIQREDEEIRNRWLHIQYSDPYKQDDSTTVVLPSAELLAAQCSVVPMLYAGCTSTGPVVVTLPQHKIDELERYRAATQHYLRLTKHCKTRGFNPWATIDRIVDDIVSDIVGGICDEMIRSCDGLASNIYLSEFLPVS